MKKRNELEVTTPSDTEITMTRLFSAPRRMVWDAMTKPDLVKRWLGAGSGSAMTVCEIDLRVGGKYRYVWSGPAGDMGMGGVYKEIVDQERIVSTEKFDDAWYPGDAVGTVTITESGGLTTLRMTVAYASKDARDGVLRSPMKEGVGRGFDAMEDLLASGA